MSVSVLRAYTRRLLATVVLASLATVGHAQNVSKPAASTPAASTPVDAANAVNDPVLKKTLEMRLGATIDGISRMPVGGLFEVRVGDEVFYADGSGNYIVVGNVIDLRTRENLTRTRVEAIKQAGLPPFKFGELPFEAAVKVVKGGGRRKVAIFEDPNCGYCKRLEKAILDVGDVTIYVFLYPVLGPDSLVKSKQIWCSANRSKAWNEWMQNAVALAGDGSCATPLDRTLELGKKLRIDGTPTLFFSNNKRVEGAIDTADLEKLLAG